MQTSDQDLSPSELKKKAFSIAHRLYASGLDGEMIYGRLEKQGIPEDIAREVISAMSQQQHQQQTREEVETKTYMGWARILLALLVAVVSYLLTTRLYCPSAL